MSKAKPAAGKGKKNVTEEEPVVVEAPKISSGTFLLPDGSKYEGEFVERDNQKLRQGQGFHSWNGDRESFKGQWDKDMVITKKIVIEHFYIHLIGLLFVKLNYR